MTKKCFIPSFWYALMGHGCLLLNGNGRRFTFRYSVHHLQYSPASLTPWIADIFNIPPEYATVPVPTADFKGDMMTSGQRLKNMSTTEAIFFWRKLFILPTLNRLAKQDFPDVQPISEIENSAELCLAAFHPVTSWARPLFIPIGAMHVRPVRILPEVSPIKPNLFRKVFKITHFDKELR